jgi:phosphate uptake regulator
MIQMFARVSDAITGATHALLADDPETARALVERDAAIVRLHREIEELVGEHLESGVDSSALARDFVTALSMLPEFEHSGELAADIARRARRGLAAEMTARARGLLERMGEVASAMWVTAADCYGEGVPQARELAGLDDEMAELQLSFRSELMAGEMPLAVTLELTLVANFFARLAAHALTLGHKVPVRSSRDTLSGVAP